MAIMRNALRKLMISRNCISPKSFTVAFPIKSPNVGVLTFRNNKSSVKTNMAFVSLPILTFVTGPSARFSSIMRFSIACLVNTTILHQQPFGILPTVLYWNTLGRQNYHSTKFKGGNYTTAVSFSVHIVYWYDIYIYLSYKNLILENGPNLNAKNWQLFNKGHG